MKQISIAAIGLGCRGYALLRDILTKMPQYRIDSVCDVYPDRIERAAGIVERTAATVPLARRTTMNCSAVPRSTFA